MPHTSIPEGTQLKQWVVEQYVASGACSDVYFVKSNNKKDSGITYAMKIASIPKLNVKNKKRKKTDAERNADALYAEHLLYQGFIKGHNGIPGIPIGGYGEDKGYRYLVMQRLGRTLENVRQQHSSIPEKTIASLGMDILDILQHLHSKKILFVDVKPENFMLEYENEKRVYCVDFGISERYILATGRHKDYKNGNIVGTPTYLSLNCHQGSTPSRRDDIEAMLYVMIYLLKGSLPWQNAKSDEEGAKLKKDTPISSLCSSISVEWKLMIEKIRQCQFEEEPDYNFFMNKLKTIGGKLHNEKYDFGSMVISTNPDKITPTSNRTRSSPRIKKPRITQSESMEKQPETQDSNKKRKSRKNSSNSSKNDTSVTAKKKTVKKPSIKQDNGREVRKSSRIKKESQSQGKLKRTTVTPTKALSRKTKSPIINSSNTVKRGQRNPRKKQSDSDVFDFTDSKVPDVFSVPSSPVRVSSAARKQNPTSEQKAVNTAIVAAAAATAAARAAKRAAASPKYTPSPKRALRRSTRKSK